ncbi:hypothetical protein [Ascidiimonas aurantiaca]|uniref:hypothetical protein n=1 Tax=Ascidiimonas aurantiaca TaxID=1685432 RepID=UPI0030EB2296
MSVNQWISSAANILLLINIILYFKSFSARGKAFKIYSFYLLVIFCIQITAIYLARSGANNLFLSHVYFVSQFVLLSFFFRELFVSHLFKQIIAWFCILALCLLILQYIFTEDILNRFNAPGMLSTSIVLIAYSVAYFYKLLDGRKKFLLVNAGILLYLVSSTLIFVTANLTNLLDRSQNKLIWILNSVLYLIYQLLIFIEWRRNFSMKKD